MPRLVFEEPKGGPAKTESAGHRQETKRDNVVVVLKAVTFALVIALVGAVILLTTAGGDDKRDAEAPAVPEIEASNVPSSPTTTPPPAEIVAPEVRSHTAVITPTAPPATTQPAPPPGPPGRADRFAVVGRACDTPGARTFTQRYEPVICVKRPNGKPVWRLVFG
ncbi:MAG: hypothetical protein WBA97_26365 [Actinophytocola sp.]|uniref:hypothetical protein n=1 Tax=Actinophytocola sp. TaxID=1872138 RepID=UPI003C75EF0F